jgi:hypothetical protein
MRESSFEMLENVSLYTTGGNRAAMQNQVVRKQARTRGVIFRLR